MLLNLHSYYSLRYGTLSLKQLIQGMKENGYQRAVLTDINNSSASLDLVRDAREEGVDILTGMEFRAEGKLCYIAIAMNAQGFQQINAYRSMLNREERSPAERAPDFSDVFVIYPFHQLGCFTLREYEYIGVRPAERFKAQRLAEDLLARCVILAPVSFLPEDYILHQQLRAIDQNLLISQLQAADCASADEVFMPQAALIALFRELPVLLHNTERLLFACSFTFDFKQPKNKKHFTGDAQEDMKLLSALTYAGFERRYASDDEIARQRIARELESIQTLHFSSYFLITDDICRYAQSRGFHYVGRGSGANSAVAYCLGITDVDPIALKLPFERFLNPKRKSPPDFDIDFSWDERDTMYAYIFEKYPEGHVALMGAVSTFRSRSILRELGKVYGLPKGDIDRLVHEPEHMLNKNEVTALILGVYNRMTDLPNQRTIHASGVLISELPLTCYSALDYPPKGLPTMQIDMYVSEDIGFEKFDILSQRGIGHIKDCRRIVQQNRGLTIDTQQPKRFFEDPHIAKQLRSANTIGCFYIESPAMRQLLTKLRCDDYLTLVAASSIIRPGVASSGMMGEFIRRHHAPDKVVYPHPVFEEQLKETYGVMVYQEDVMKIGNAYGGLDMADADVLRRMMSGKYRNKKHLIEIEDKFFAHCRAMDYPEQTSREIWRQMESFAGYSFNKAHSASYAVESYQSLYLKTYFPLEFMVSVLNNYGGFYNRKVYVNEARVAGGNICLPCVNHSEFVACIYDKDIYLGFDCLLNLEGRLAQRIAKERQQGGAYLSLQDFIQRTSVAIEQLVILIRVGAFRFLGQSKKSLLWEAHLYLSRHKEKHQAPVLFASVLRKPVLPPLEDDILEDYYDEMELIGFGVSGTLFDLARSDFRGAVMAQDLLSVVGQTVRMVGDYVAEKTVRTKRGELMKFGTFFDVKGTFFDTVHFPPSLQGFPLRGPGLYLIEGKVTEEFGCAAIEVLRCGKMPLKADPRSV